MNNDTVYESKYGIIIPQNNVKNINVLQWYEYLFKTPNGKKIQQMPDFVYADINNLIKIWRYIFEVKLNIKNREEVINVLPKYLKKYKAFFICKKNKKPYNFNEIIRYSFPEYNIKEWELFQTSNSFYKNDNNVFDAIDWLINKYNYDLNDILNNKITLHLIQQNNLISAFRRFSSIHDLLIWFCNKKYNINLIYSDFKIKPKRYMHNKNNANFELKKFITQLFNDNILTKENFKYELQNIFNQDFLRDNGQYQFITASLYHYKTTIFYHWLNDIFPEWKLKPNDFKIHLTFDNKKLDSRGEVEVYNCIKKDLGINIKIFGRKKKYLLLNKKTDEKYIPDFYITKIFNYILDKPLYIEFYGMYKVKYINPIFEKYFHKTHRKNEFYENNKDIYFIDLYPEDIKNNCEGVKNKLTSFFMKNFNINILQGGDKNFCITR